MNKTKEEIEQIAEQVVDAMLKVHRALGPGLLESTYQACLAHEAQLLTYLKLSGHRLGFLVNWNVPLIKDGMKRMVNGL